MLEKQFVDVWPIRLEAPPEIIANFAGLLSPDELERAGRFAFPRLRDSFTLGRGALRILLGRRLEVAPGNIQFAYGEKGKPHLADPGAVRFNLSHSGTIALVAITQDRELGVDIEKHRPMSDREGIARRFFSPEEVDALLTLPEHLREAAFYRCWTRKEAYIKAIGDGLSAPLNGFAVSLRPEEQPRILQIGGKAEAAAQWAMHALEIECGYTAALAYRDAPREVRLSAPINPADLLP